MLMPILFGFLDVACHLDYVGIDVFCNVPPNSKEIELVSRDLKASPSVGKNTRVVLVPSRAWKCVPTANSGDVDIFEVPGCHLLRQMSS